MNQNNRNTDFSGLLIENATNRNATNNKRNIKEIGLLVENCRILCISLTFSNIGLLVDF